jgi:hypothetical protein
MYNLIEGGSLKSEFDLFNISLLDKQCERDALKNKIKYN